MKTITEKFAKPKRAIDYLPDDPGTALEKVWGDIDLPSFLHDELRYWFYMALSHEGTVYNNTNIHIRATFVEFYADLLPFVEASFCCFVRNTYSKKHSVYPDLSAMPEVLRNTLQSEYQCVYLTDEEEVSPHEVLMRFCVKYPIDYVRRELWDFLAAVQFYAGPLLKRVSTHCFSEYHMKMLTMVEIAYLLVQRDRH